MVSRYGPWSIFLFDLLVSNHVDLEPNMVNHVVNRCLTTWFRRICFQSMVNHMVSSNTFSTMWSTISGSKLTCLKAKRSSSTVSPRRPILLTGTQTQRTRYSPLPLVLRKGLKEPKIFVFNIVPSSVLSSLRREMWSVCNGHSACSVFSTKFRKCTC